MHPTFTRGDNMALWSPESTITLYRVPWDISYSDVVDWNNTDRDTFFASLPSHMVETKSESAYMPLGMSIVIDMPYEQARKFNYCVVENPAQPVDGDSGYKLYYFITETTYPNPSATTLTCELDVWTTRITETQFNMGYVVRSSCAMANSPLVNATNYPQALNRYCSQGDGVATGDYYTTFYTDVYQIDESDENEFICIVSTVELLNDSDSQGLRTNDWGTVDNPKLQTAHGCQADGVYSGCSVYFLAENRFQGFLQIMSKYPWVSQCIVSMYSLPSSMVNMDKVSLGYIYDGTGTVRLYYPSIKGSQNYAWESGSLPRFGDASISIDRFKSSHRYNSVTNAYSKIDKLNTYPYSVIEMTDGLSGQSVFLKPELLGSSEVPLVYMACSIKPFLEFVVFPEFYNNYDGREFTFTYTRGDDQITKTVPYGEVLNCAIWLDNFPSWSIVNNAYLAYMAGTAHTRQYQYDNAQWTLQRSNLSANNTYDNAMLSATSTYQNAMIEKNRAQQEFNAEIYQMQLQNKADILNYLPGQVMTTIGYAGTGLLAGGTMGAVGGAAGIAYGIYQGAANIDAMNGQLIQANAQNDASQKAMLASANLNKYTSTTIAANNLSVASQTNTGDYDMQVQALDAAYADAALTQPSQSGNMGGDGFRYSNGLSYMVTVRYKTVNDDAIVRNGDFFYRFGYAVNRYMHIPTKLVVNKHYSYWKIEQLETASMLMNETEKSVICGIFSNGVTVWKDPYAIGNVIPSDNQIDEDAIDTYYI